MEGMHLAKITDRDFSAFADLGSRNFIWFKRRLFPIPSMDDLHSPSSLHSHRNIDCRSDASYIRDWMHTKKMKRKAETKRKQGRDDEEDDEPVSYRARFIICSTG